MKTYTEWRYSSNILGLGTRWRRMISFTPRPLNSRGKSFRYPLDMRLGWPQSQPGRREEEKNLFPCRESNPGSPTRILSLYQLIYPGSYSLHTIVTHYYSLFDKYHPVTTYSAVNCTEQATTETLLDMLSATLCTNTGRCYPTNGKTRERCFKEPENRDRRFLWTVCTIYYRNFKCCYGVWTALLYIIILIYLNQ
jgi:hypothetical protein